MCGIVGGVSKRNISPILLEGLRRLEYRGYDSSGIAVLNDNHGIDRHRATGKVEQLSSLLESAPIDGTCGIAHTRWATHGGVDEKNAHPHICDNSVAIVHNGIIENHEELRNRQSQQGYRFTSETDTEVIVHQIHDAMKQHDHMLDAVKASVAELRGAYALGVISSEEPGTLIATRKGSPLVIGVGFDEYFIASDISALLPVTQKFIYLEEGDIARLQNDSIEIYSSDGERVEREIVESTLCATASDRGEFRHFMLKEIYEQPTVFADTLEGRIGEHAVYTESFGVEAEKIFASIEHVHIIACGTSFHAGMVARYWLESIAGIPCQVEVASEFRYRTPFVPKNALFVTVSQSGETADTLAALRIARDAGYSKTLSICNVPESSLVRESDLQLMTRAGPEIGVASTKAFTTQLIALMLLVTALGKHHRITAEKEAEIVAELKQLPVLAEGLLAMDEPINLLAERFVEKQDALFLGRGIHYPIAMEGALKLKEISYIHAEAYPAGELKHGPLALVDADMPVIAVAPTDSLLEKLKSNLEEVRARGGELYVFAETSAGFQDSEFLHFIPMSVNTGSDIIAPILFTIPLQLLSYHVAVMKGTDVDHPRNLAKSVTVE